MSSFSFVMYWTAIQKKKRSKVQKQGRSFLMLDYSVTVFITKQKRCMVARAKTKEKRTETREIFLMLAHSINKNNEIFFNASYLCNE